MNPYALHHEADTLAWPPRPYQVGLALARIADRVSKCEAHGDAHRLDEYLHARVDGRANPLGNLRQYRAIQDDVSEAADTLRLGGAS